MISRLGRRRGPGGKHDLLDVSLSNCACLYAIRVSSTTARIACTTHTLLQLLVRCVDLVHSIAPANLQSPPTEFKGTLESSGM